MTKWEYATRDVNPAQENVDDVLREQGAKGWELVQVMPAGNMRLVFYFKRPQAGQAPQVRIVHHDPLRIENLLSHDAQPEITGDTHVIEDGESEVSLAVTATPIYIADITDDHIKALNDYGQAAYDSCVANAKREWHPSHNVSDTLWTCYGCGKEAGDNALYEPCPTPDHVGQMTMRNKG
jgi:hypothetical protein